MTNTNNLPTYLCENARFCLWKYEQRGGKMTKVPYDPSNPTHRAKANDPATFASLEVAREALHANAGVFDGLGIGIFGELAGIDIDHCIKDGELSPMAQTIVDTMDTYTEISPSGEGIRIIFRTRMNGFDKRRYYIKHSEIGLEIYMAGMTNRFLTVTGNVINDMNTSDRYDRLQDVLDHFMQRPQQQTTEAMPSEPLDIEDGEILDRAAAAGNGDKFTRLWNGDTTGYPSHSEADQALCNLLAFWTGRDAHRMDSLFRQSGLMREKWDRKQSGTTYGAITIERAISSCTEVYKPRRDAQADAYDDMGYLPIEAEEEPEIVSQKPIDPVTEFDRFLEQVQTPTYQPVKTGMAAFDNLLGGGITPQSLVVMSAAPGAGKTAFASQLFETMARNGHDVLFLNLEMSAEYLLARSLSRIIDECGYKMTATDVLRGYGWSDEQRMHVMKAAEEYRRDIAPHMFYNPHGHTSNIEEISATLERYGMRAKAEGRPAPCVVLDYMHLVTSSDRAEAGELVKRTVTMLKDYAIRYDTFSFAIGANNRTSNRAGIVSQDSGRDSSAIEYTADLQLSLNYKELAEREKNDKGDTYSATNPEDMAKLQGRDTRDMVVQVLKNRMGKTGGKLYLKFHAAQSRFVPVDTAHDYFMPQIVPMPQGYGAY